MPTRTTPPVIVTGVDGANHPGRRPQEAVATVLTVTDAPFRHPQRDQPADAPGSCPGTTSGSAREHARRAKDIRRDASGDGRRPRTLIPGRERGGFRRFKDTLARWPGGAGPQVRVHRRPATRPGTGLAQRSRVPPVDPAVITGATGSARRDLSTPAGAVCLVTSSRSAHPVPAGIRAGYLPGRSSGW